MKLYRYLMKENQYDLLGTLINIETKKDGVRIWYVDDANEIEYVYRVNSSEYCVFDDNINPNEQ